MSASDDVQGAVSAQGTVIRLDPRNIWRIGFVVMALIAIFLLLRFFIDDAGGVLFILLMAWFAALAMEPAVGRLARYMRRGLATGMVMLAFIIGMVLFSIAFGGLMVEQIASLIEALPVLLTEAINWFNQRFGTDYSIQEILKQLNLEPAQVAQYASQVLGGILGILGSVVGGVFSLFTLGLFTFYFSADAPRLRRWIASLFPPRVQAPAMEVWEVTAQKVGGYVAARLILAFINGGTSAIVFWIIGMPSWLALGVWTGVVAQFVPTIGTYIAIALPVLVGLLSDDPKVGILALVWALIYQQVENLTVEPRISARAVNVHPAIAFASVMFGAALFGVAGALLAVPVAAMILAIGEARRTKYAVLDDAIRDGANPT